MKRFFQNENGATAIEYAFIALLIALVLITAAMTVGENLTAVFGDVNAGFASGEGEGG